jgi:hypothetical protein
MKQIKILKVLGIVGIFAVIVLLATGKQVSNNSATTSRSDAVEITYKAVSPNGKSGGTILPASCESNAWNNNGGYHTDGVNADPGNCAAVIPPPPVCNVNKGAACNSSVNRCGMTNPGTIACDGSCNAVAPTDASCPPTCTINKGKACTSAANSCGMTDTGIIECDGTCNAVTPSNASCPVTRTTGQCAASLNGKELPSKPSTGLCDKGIPSLVSGSGSKTDPWSWTCTVGQVVTTVQSNTKTSIQSMQLAQVSGGIGSRNDQGLVNCGPSGFGLNCQSNTPGMERNDGVNLPGSRDINIDQGFNFGFGGGGIIDTIISTVITTIVTPVIETITPVIRVVMPTFGDDTPTIPKTPSTPVMPTFGDDTPVIPKTPIRPTPGDDAIEVCTATKSNAVDDLPAMPVIGGTSEIEVGLPTGNTIVATDPEGDSLYYEIDWNWTSGVPRADGTTGASASGAISQIGHIYNTVGTYTVKGRAIEVHGLQQKSAWATYSIRVVARNTLCTETNACGVLHIKNVSGACIATPLPNRYSDSCTTANSCGMTSTGTVTCSGACSAAAPSDSKCSEPCVSEANNCGDTATVPRVNGVCNPAPVKPVDRSCPGSDPTTITDFRASPKLISLGKTSKLYWQVTGPAGSCTISYTTATNSTPVSVVPGLPSSEGNKDTGPVTEKRLYLLKCGDKTATAEINVFSLTEI